MYIARRTHPVDDLPPTTALIAARRDLLGALQGRSAADLLAPLTAGRSVRDTLLAISIWLRELSHLVPDLATLGYGRGEPSDAGSDRQEWQEQQIALYRAVRPEAALSGLVTAHARLLEAIAPFDAVALHRHGPTRFGFSSSGWDLLHTEALDERQQAAQWRAELPLLRPATLEDERCLQRAR